MFKYELISDAIIEELNEDIVHAVNNNIWIFDGATPLYKEGRYSHYSSSSQWYVNEFSNEIIKAIKLKDDFISAIDSSYEVFREKNMNVVNIDKNRLPSLAMSAITVLEENIDLYCLADCAIYIQNSKGDVKRIVDDRYDAYEVALIEKWQQINKNSFSEKERDRLFLKARKKILEKRNVKGGYWVATIRDNWIKEVVHLRVDKRNVKKILLCTDGFDRLFTLYKKVKPEDIFSGKWSLSDCINIIRKTEEIDSNNSMYPRIKVSDDATAALIHLM